MLAIVTKEQFDALVEPVQAEYVKLGDGKYKAKIDSVDGFGLEDVQGLKNTVATLRTEARTKDATIKSFGDLDPKIAREALTKVKALGDMTLEDKVAESIKQREAALIAKHQEELEKVSGTNKSLKTQLETVLVRNVVVNALSEHDDKVILPDFIEKRVSMRDNGDGKMIAVVLDEQGNEAIGDSQGTPMTVKQLVDGMRGQQQYARYFGGTGASGSGSSGAGSATGGVKLKGGVKTISEDDVAGIQENLDAIEKGDVQVVPAVGIFAQQGGSEGNKALFSE